jgi:outer membrane protein insertion porin family
LNIFEFRFKIKLSDVIIPGSYFQKVKDKIVISNNRIGYLLIAILVWLMWFGSGLQAKIKITDANQIQSLAVKGDQHIKKKIILREVKLKPGDVYTQSVAEEDLRRIYGLGYFADVTLDIVKETAGVKVTYVVKENPVIIDIVFEGNNSYRAKRLKDEVGFKRNSVMQADSLDKFEDKLRTWYESKEYTVEIHGTYEPITETTGKLHFKVIEHKKQKIVQVEVQGNQHLKSKKILKQLKTKKSWWIIKRFFDETDAETDCLLIDNLYKEEGYIKAKTTVLPPEPVAKPPGVKVRFNIEEGAQYQWDKIAITGNTLFSTGELERYLRSSTKKIYRQSAMEGDMVRLYEPYANQGYIQNQVKPIITANDTTQTVDVNYLILESPRIYLGNINVQGMAFTEDKTIQEVPMKTKRKVVLREVTLKPGDVFSRKEVLISKQKLDNLGFFDQVAPTPEPTLAEDTMDLLISIIERKTGNITFGGGYSSEKKAGLFVELTEPNLFGTGRQVRLHTEIAEEGTDYSLTYQEPYFLDTPLTVELSIFRESLDRSIDGTSFSYDSSGGMVYGDSSTHEYQERQTGGSIFVSYPITPHLRWTGRLKHVQVKLDPDDEGYQLPAALGPVESLTQSITPGLIYDNRDNYFWPTRGSRYVANIEYAGGLLGGDNDYIKYYAEGSWYKQLGAKMIGAARLRGGYIQPYGDSEDAPLPDRFFLGGSNTLRGYDFRGVSPHLVYQDQTNQEEYTLDIGGDVMLNLNLELRRPLVSRVYGLLFLDAGGVWAKTEDVDLSTVRYGVGPGLLLNLPIGYIQLGYGFPLNKQPGDETQRIYFTFGTTF